VKKTVVLLLYLAFVGNLAILEAQVTVALRRDRSSIPLPGMTLLCDKNYNCGLAATELSKASAFEFLIKISRAGKDFYLLADTNQNGTLADERRIFLPNSGTVAVNLRKRTSTSRYEFLPFEIAHEALEQSGEPDDQFVLRPRYIASGVLSYKTCTSSISLLDMNYDGRFTFADSERGTNLQIDKNRDGKFWGKDEHVRTAEIVAFCGQNFLVTSLSNRSLVLMPTNLRLAKINEQVPDFSMALLNGHVISASSLKGKAYVLDFWASWCVPCVKNLPQIESVRKEYGSLSVFSVNVDNGSRRAMAQRIIDDAGIHEFTTVRGLGNDDPLWKAFGGANSNRLAIPLYVLIGKDSVVRYAGDGGEKLAELKREIEKLLSAF